MSAEYRIEFSIQRQRPDEDDYTEIGFGSSGGGCTSLDEAAYAVESYVANGHWETSDDMPDPDEVMSDIARAREADR